MCTVGDGGVCESIASACEFFAELPDLGLNDIDTDENGVGDAMSAERWLSGFGATLGDVPIAE